VEAKRDENGGKRGYVSEWVRSLTNLLAWETCWVESMLLAEPAETDNWIKIVSVYWNKHLSSDFNLFP